MTFRKLLAGKPLASCSAAALGLLLCGCTLPSPNLAQSTGSYKTVAFISLLPQSITMWHLGFTVFQNDSGAFPLEFDPNVLATQTADALLSPRYEVKDIGVDNEAFLTAVHNHFSMLNQISGTEGLVQDELKASVKPGQVDVIVVLDGSQPPSTANFVSGNILEVGLISTSAWSGLVQVLQHTYTGDMIGVAATVEVYDGTTFQELARGWGQGVPNDGVSSLGWRGETYSRLSTAQKQNLENVEKTVINDYVTTALPSVHLTAN